MESDLPSLPRSKIGSTGPTPGVRPSGTTPSPSQAGTHLGDRAASSPEQSQGQSYTSDFSQMTTASLGALLVDLKIITKQDWERAVASTRNPGNLEELLGSLEELTASWADDDSGAVTALTRFQIRQIQVGNGHLLRFGNYVILELLGSGGMGDVYKALHVNLRRVDALKTIRNIEGIGSTGGEARERFEREAQILATLKHPYITTVYDAGIYNGVPFIAMEYVRGRDLKKIVDLAMNDGETIPFPWITERILEVASALQHVHERNIFHRDIKPSNLIINEDNDLKVLDMGIARLVTPQKEGTNKNLTQAFAKLGTPEYMPPEQWAAAATVTAASDLYSLGCTYFYLLTGRPPFQADNMVKLMQMHLTQPPPSVRQFRQDVPPLLDEILAKMLAKQAEDRFQTADEFIRAMQPIRRTYLPREAEETQKHTSAAGLVFLAVSIILMIAIAVGGYFWYLDVDRRAKLAKQEEEARQKQLVQGTRQQGSSDDAGKEATTKLATKTGADLENEGKDFLQSGKFADAKTAFELAITRHVESADIARCRVLHALACLSQGIDDADTALDSLRAASELDPGVFVAQSAEAKQIVARLIEFGDKRSEEKDFLKAKVLFLSSLSVDANSFEALLGLGKAQFNQNELNDAIDSLTKALAQKANDQRALHFRALAYQRQRKLAEAIEDANTGRSIADAQSRTEFDRLLGSLHKEQAENYDRAGKFQDAIKQLGLAVQFDGSLKDEVASKIAVVNGKWGMECEKAKNYDLALPLLDAAIKAGVDNLEVRFALANSLAAKGQLSDAIAEYKRVRNGAVGRTIANLDAEEAKTSSKLGEKLFTSGNLDEARDYLLSASRLDSSQSAKTKQLLVDLYLAKADQVREKDPKQAIASVRDALHLDRENKKVIDRLWALRMEVGESLLKQNDKAAEAISIFDELTKERPNDDLAWIGLSKARRATGDLNGARLARNKAIDINKKWRVDNAADFIESGKKAIEAKNYLAAISDLESAIDYDMSKRTECLPLLLTALEKESERLENQGEYPAAVALLDKAVSFDSTRGDKVRKKKANLWLLDAKRQAAPGLERDAIASLTKSIELDNTIAESFLLRGKSRLALARSNFDLLTDVEKDLEAARKLDNKVSPAADLVLAEVFELKGMAAIRQRNADAVIASFKRAGELNKQRKPDFDLKTVDFLLQEGSDLLTATKTKEAIDVLSKVIDLDKNNARAFLKRGEAYVESSRYDLAEKDLERAVELEKSLVDRVNLQKARIFEQKGVEANRKEDFETAARCFEEAGDLNPARKQDFEEKAALAYYNAAKKALQIQGKRQQALDWAKQAAKTDAKKADDYNEFVAEISFEIGKEKYDSKQYSNALEPFKLAASLTKKADIKRIYQQYISVTLVWMAFEAKPKNINQAIDYLSQALEYQPQDPKIYKHRAIARQEAKKLKEAQADAAEAIKLEQELGKENHDTYLLRVELIQARIESGDVPESESLQIYQLLDADLKRAITLKPTDPRTNSRLALHLATCPHHNLRNGARAVEAAKVAVAADSRNWEYQFALANAFAQEGRAKEAETAMSAAIELAPEADRTNLERLKTRFAGGEKP